MKSVAQTVIEADRFYTIAAKTGSVIQAVENAKDGGSIRLGKYGHAPEQEWAFIRKDFVRKRGILRFAGFVHQEFLKILIGLGIVHAKRSQTVECAFNSLHTS